jgi:hypothetical protein
MLCGQPAWKQPCELSMMARVDLSQSTLHGVWNRCNAPIMCPLPKIKVANRVLLTIRYNHRGIVILDAHDELLMLFLHKIVFVTKAMPDPV